MKRQKPVKPLDLTIVIQAEALANRVREKNIMLSLNNMARASGVSATTIKRVRDGHIPNLLNYVKLCIWLNVPFNRFINVFNNNFYDYLGKPEELREYEGRFNIEY